MRKIFLLLFVSAGMMLQAQTTKALKKVMELKMPKAEEDDMAGKRGASVTWHPVQKKYYAVFAGNSQYPLAVFDANGSRVSNDELTAMIDTRGLWYNPATKLICGNGYDDGGWFSYDLDNTGIPEDYEEIVEGMNQPGQQCVGAYNPDTKEVLFLDKSLVYIYNSEGDVVSSVTIHWGRKKEDGASDAEDPSRAPEDYNRTTVIYSGIKGQELGVLNITNKYIELYDIKTGFLTKTFSLPETAKAEASFNFAYSNDIFWLFDMDQRKWNGYK